MASLAPAADTPKDGVAAPPAGERCAAFSRCGASYVPATRASLALVRNTPQDGNNVPAAAHSVLCVPDTGDLKASRSGQRRSSHPLNQLSCEAKAGIHCFSNSAADCIRCWAGGLGSMHLHPPPRPMPPAGAPNLLGAPEPLLPEGAGAPAAKQGRIWCKCTPSSELKQQDSGLPVVSRKVLLMSYTQPAAVWPFNWPSRHCFGCITLPGPARKAGLLRSRQDSSTNLTQVKASGQMRNAAKHHEGTSPQRH